MHIDDIPPLLINPDGGIVGFFTASIGGVDEEFNDVVEGVFLVVPEYNAELIFHHRIGRGLEPKICFAGWDRWFVGRVVKGIQDEVEGIGYGLSHRLL